MATSFHVSVVALLLSAALASNAQSLEEGIRMVYYERYNSAARILQPLANNNAAANYYLGLAQLGAGDPATAQATFSKYPDDAANKAGLARLAFASGKPAEGLAKAQAVASSTKKKEWMPLVYAADAINYGPEQGTEHIPQAIAWYEEALRRGGDQVSVRIGLGDAYQKIPNGGGSSMNHYEAAIAKDPKNSLGHSRIGKLWYDARVYTDALTSYAKAKEADPDNPLPYSDLADAYYWVGKYELAKQNIARYYELSDKTCDDKIRYANILYLAKDYTEAISRMQEVLGSCGDRVNMYRLLGHSQAETKDYVNALINMRSFFAKQAGQTRIRLLPQDYLYMGRIFAAQGQADSGEHYFAKAIALDTAANKRKLYIDIAEAYKSLLTTGGYAKAGSYYRRAVETSAAAAAVLDYYYWGFYSFNGRQLDEAARAFEQMENRFSDQPTATFWRARVAAAVDSTYKTGAAVPYFNKWLAIPETDAFKRKSETLMMAYQYLALVAYYKDDRLTLKENLERIKAIDPNNAVLKQLEGIQTKPAGATRR